MADVGSTEPLYSSQEELFFSTNRERASTEPLYSSQEGLFFSTNRERGSTLGVGSTGGGGPTIIIPPPLGTLTYFKMVGRDVDCGPFTLRFWTVSGTPDLTGAQYVGVRCGVTFFSDVYVAAVWQQ